MNLIFDIGNVLINFKPVSFLKELFPEQATADKINETIFRSPEWPKMDLGLITHKEAAEIFCLREPSFKQEILYTMQKLGDMLTPMSDTVDLLPKLKERNHKLYLLSNIHKELRDYLMAKYQFFTLFEGGVFSCDININKPAPEIYRKLLEEYRLPAKDCLFFDDMEENIEAAKKRRH
jgi:putative hydrolase of the HAD superfamily